MSRLTVVYQRWNPDDPPDEKESEPRDVDLIGQGDDLLVRFHLANEGKANIYYLAVRSISQQCHCFENDVRAAQGRSPRGPGPESISPPGPNGDRTIAVDFTTHIERITINAAGDIKNVEVKKKTP